MESPSYRTEARPNRRISYDKTNNTHAIAVNQITKVASVPDIFYHTVHIVNVTRESNLAASDHYDLNNFEL